MKNMYRLNYRILLFTLFTIAGANAQNLTWTGEAGDNAFFNEANWKNTATNTTPTAGTIDPGVAINANLTIENATGTIGSAAGISNSILIGTGNLVIRNSTINLAATKGIDMGSATNSLTIDGAVVTTDFLTNSTTTLTGESKLYLRATDPFDTATNINITSTDAWIFASNLNPVTAATTHIPRVKINGSSLVDMTNARVSQYYYGCAIAPYSPTIAPLRVYDNANLSGNYTDIPIQTLWSGSTIPGNFNDRIVSFKLKKGYMVTMAIDSDGTNLSKVYVASESDLTVNILPDALSGKVSFIRVIPWLWVNKKGFGKQNSINNDDAFFNIINNRGLWYYDWGMSRNSTSNFEYATMSWGKTSIDTQAERNTIINKARVTHLMSFNEADDCNAQSGQYGSLCVHDTAALWHKHAMKLGLRIVSPSCRENQETVWLATTNSKMIPDGTRFDAIGMHWYDWDGYLNNKASDATSIFNRFKNRVIACYNYYKMPIWITEFNANLYRPRETHDAFLQLALPWLESTPYVERYAFYQPNSGIANFLDANNNLTTTGAIYLNYVSTPSVPESLVNSYINNLEMSATNGMNSFNLSLPTSTSDLTLSPGNNLLVTSGATLTIDRNTEVNSVTVAAGAKLNLNSAYTLTASNGITLQNTASGTASFVDERTADNPSAIAGTVEQIITGKDRNWYVAVPVAGKVASDITLTGASIVKRNEVTAGWDPVNAGSALTAGVGYIALASASTGNTTWTLAGNLNSGKVEVGVTRSGTGFNLLGNPYPSFLNWEQVLNLNATNASLLQGNIWYRTATYNESLSKYVYTFNTYNSTSRIASPLSTSGYIPPMQAFWVRANSAGTVTFTNAMRSHGDGASNKLKVPQVSSQKIVRLQVANSINITDEAVVYFDANAQNSFDKYDSEKMFNNTASKPEIFTQAGIEKLVINGLNTLQYDTEIPLGFATATSGDFSISRTEMTNFETGTQIILKDALNPGTEFKLTESNSYNFSSQQTTANTNRFSLLFRAPGVSTSTENTYGLDAQVYINEANQITILAPKKSNYVIYNAAGQMISNSTTHEGKTIVGGKTAYGGFISNGFYVVKVTNKGRELITRVIIK